MTCESVACRSYFTNKSVRDVCALRDLWCLWAMCVRASMKAAKPLHIVVATNPNPTRARGYPLNINPKPDPKPDSISGPAGSGRVADLYAVRVKYRKGTYSVTIITSVPWDMGTSTAFLALLWAARSVASFEEIWDAVASSGLYSQTPLRFWGLNSHWLARHRRGLVILTLFLTNIMYLYYNLVCLHGLMRFHYGTMLIWDVKVFL